MNRIQTNTALNEIYRISFLLCMGLVLLCQGDIGLGAIIGSFGIVQAFVSPKILSRTARSPTQKSAPAIDQQSLERTEKLMILVSLNAAPRRLADNVNDKCINCSACAMFAPSVFSRDTKQDIYHIVSKQPVTDLEIEESRAALVACPVAAIRVDNAASTNAADEEMVPLASQFAIQPELNGRKRPFPRPVSPNVADVYFVGHHNAGSFGAVPYLLLAPTAPTSSSEGEPTWILVDTPKYSKKAVEAVESLTGSEGPSHLVLTHVDDTADHNLWKEHFPNMKRIFHSGDLGKYNWVGDETLEDVEILLQSSSSDNELQHFTLDGTPIDNTNSEPLVLLHTPGHSPGSISLLKRPTDDSTPGVLFTGDTYAYTTRDGGHGSGFPRYNKESRELQSKVLRQLIDLDWQVLAPGHGHARDYTLLDGANNLRNAEIEEGIEELSKYF